MGFALTQNCIFSTCRGPASGKRICGNSFADVRVCPSCGMQRLDPPRSQTQLDALHADPGYFNHPYFAARRTLKDTHRRNAYRRVVNELFPDGVARGTNILDVGCDTGAFLDVAQRDFGMSVAGIEISPISAEIAIKKGFKVYVGSILNVTVDQKFDAIVINDVIEHVEAPNAMIEKLVGLLNPDGRLFISTPNGDALIYILGRLIFKAFGRVKLLDKLYLPYHEWYFPPRALRRLVESNGLNVVSHNLVEFPFSEFGHGAFLKTVMAAIFSVQFVVRRPSVQYLVAQKVKT